MSITTADVPNVGIGFPDEATPGIPDLPPEVLPETGDAPPPFTEDAPDALAGVEGEPQVEDPQIAELRTQWEAEYRERLVAELTEPHKEQIANLQRIKDREVREAKDVVAAKVAGENAMYQEFGRILQELGVDPQSVADRMELARARVGTKEQQAFAQAQQEVATTQQIADVVAQRFQERQEEAKARGEVPLDPMDPDVMQWRSWFTEVNQRYMSGALRAQENAQAGRPIDPRDYQAQQEWNKAIGLMNDFETRHRATVTARTKAAHDAQIALDQKNKRARQDARGAQHTVTGSGAGPMSADAAWDTATREFPDDHDARFKRYRQLQNPQAR